MTNIEGKELEKIHGNYYPKFAERSIRAIANSNMFVNLRIML